jgi:hypothetical protein
VEEEPFFTTGEWGSVGLMAGVIALGIGALMLARR